MIEFCQVTKGFKTDFWDKSLIVLDNLSFKIQKGALTGFLGANGSGKTTSMKIMMGFIKANQGNIIFDSSLGSTHQDIFSKIGYLPERPYFYPHLTGREFLVYMGEINLVDKKLLEERIAKWSEKLSIKLALERKIRGYSKGMLQRLGFVSVLLHDPEILVLDEPLSGLDPIGRKELKDTIEALHDDGKTIFFSSHIVSDIEEICSDVIVLEEGKAFYQGSLEDLLKKHGDMTYSLTYRDNFAENKQTIEVSESEKCERIKAIVDSGGDIFSVKELQPTLEEIIYKTK